MKFSQLQILVIVFEKFQLQIFVIVIENVMITCNCNWKSNDYINVIVAEKVMISCNCNSDFNYFRKYDYFLVHY